MKMLALFAETVGEAGVAAGCLVVLDGAGDSFFIADEYAEITRSRYAGIEQITLQHHVLAGVHYHDDRFVLAALGFMYRHCIRKL